MKIRQGFVSNSSSSSFIIKKSVLNGSQMEQLNRFFRAYKDWGNNEFNDNDKTYEGSVEAHGHEEYTNKSYSTLLQELVESFEVGVPNKGKTMWFDIAYENEVSLDPNFKREY